MATVTTNIRIFLTAPQSGVYVFSFTLFPYRGSSIAVNIYRNSEVAGQVYTYISSPDVSGTSMVAVLSMTIGDVTFIRTSPTTTSSGYVYRDGNVKSSFAGWKLLI
jgi:hypothetical protein